ncbi:hypothetical protein D3C76_1405200 [compost metagenome]
MGHGVRARANQRHAALQGVEQLWQFIDGGATDKLADSSDAWVFTAGLLNLLVVVHAHGAELPDLDDLAVPAMAFLLE